jgi:hypothetical protein
MAPATISSVQDLVQYRVEDASPLDQGAPNGYVERYIHSEIYKQYPAVNSVIHSHSHAVVPYTISSQTKRPTSRVPSPLQSNIFLDVPFRACFHMAGFLGESTRRRGTAMILLFKLLL